MKRFYTLITFILVSASTLSAQDVDVWLSLSYISPSYAFWNGSTDFTYGVTFEGDSTVDVTLNPKVNIYISSNFYLDSTDILLDSSTVEVGNSMTVNGDTGVLDLPFQAFPGNWYIIFVLDPDNEIAEIDENNNLIRRSLEIISSCNYNIYPSSASVGYLGGNRSLTVDAQYICNWTVSTSCSWITITSNTSGSGYGYITYVVDENPNVIIPRTCTITVNGRPHFVMQSGAPCSYEITSDSASYNFAGGTGSFEMIAPSTYCYWSITDSCDWITPISNFGGAGSQTIEYLVEENPTTLDRSCTLWYNTENYHTVYQSGNADLGLMADFTASSLTGVAPLSVDFTDASVGNPTSWVWSFAGASPTGSLIQNPSGIVYTNPGVYDVILQVSNSYGIDEEIKLAYIEVDISTGISSLTDVANFSLLQNPVKDWINLEIESNVRGKQFYFELLSVDGKVIEKKQEVLQSGKSIVQFDAANLAKGIYILNIQMGGFTHAMKVVKE